MGAIDIELYRRLGTRDALGQTLLELGDEYPEMFVLAADCMASVRGRLFADKYPHRAVNFGIAEANMMMAAAGMATCGKIPVACTFGFLASLRTCEMIRSGICYPNLNVKIAATSSGLAMGTGGTTHHVTEDIAVLRSFANLTILAPCDGVSATKAVRAATELKGPVYLRLGRGAEPNVYKEDFDFKIGRAIVTRDGSDVTLISMGATMPRVLEAADILADKGISARVLDMMSLKPIDRDAILQAARETKLIVTAEDHSILGGLGGAVAEVLVEKPSVPLLRIGIKDTFCALGPTDELMDKYGLSGKAISEEVLKSLEA